MRILAWLAPLLFLASCHRDDEKIPFPLSKEETPAILLDIHYAEAAMQNLYGETRDSMTEVYYDQVCALHDIRRGQLDTALMLLREDPEYMLEVYNEMMEIIAEREAQAQNDED